MNVDFFNIEKEEKENKEMIKYMSFNETGDYFYVSTNHKKIQLYQNDKEKIFQLIYETGKSNIII
jgi:hypothetical protein